MVEAVLADHLTAPIAEPLRAMLTFLDKMTVRPEALSKEDLVPLRAQGLSNAAIREAIHVAAIFNVYDRLADSLGWEVPVDASFEAGAKLLLKNGYDL
jgi:uncharacterized peroxidase-related enzyme